MLKHLYLFASDIDECAEQTAACDQMCHNTNGSYECSCKEGFYIDEYACKGNAFTYISYLNVSFNKTKQRVLS